MNNENRRTNAKVVNMVIQLAEKCFLDVEVVFNCLHMYFVCTNVTFLAVCLSKLISWKFHFKG